MGDEVGGREWIVRQDQIPKTEEHNETQEGHEGRGRLRHSPMMTDGDGGKEASEMIPCPMIEVGVVSTTGDDKPARLRGRRHSATSLRLRRLFTAAEIAFRVITLPQQHIPLALKDSAVLCSRIRHALES